MKSLILLLLIFSCTKAKYKEIPGSTREKTYVSALRIDFKEYSQNIDLIVAFLWPDQIQTEIQRHELQSIISTSRELKSQKEKFQIKRYELSDDYRNFDCPCILEFRCQGDETQNDEEKCLQIEEGIFENDKRLPEIYALVDVMKEKVLNIGGEWLATNQDYPEIPLSSFNFNNLALNLKAFGAAENRPLNYEFTRPEIFEDESYQLLKFSSPRKSATGNWRIEVSPYKNQASLVFQGELYWDRHGIKRQGIIFWEHARLYE